MVNYEAMPLDQQLQIIDQEVANKNTLSAKGSMWQKASQELAEAGRSLAGATTNIAPEWDDGAGTKFVAVSRRTLTEIDTWQQNIDGAKPHDKIYLVANTLPTTQGVVQEQMRLALEAVRAAQANAAAGYAAQGVGSPELTQAQVNAIMLPFQQEAGRAMNTLGGYYEDAAWAVTTASGGDPMQPQAPFSAGPTSSPSSASPGGEAPAGAPPGGAAPGGAAPGGAAPGGAAPGGAAPGGAAPGATGAGGDPSLAGGLAGGAPTPTPTLPPGLGTTPPTVPGGLGTVPPFIPPVGGLGGVPRSGGFGGGFGGGGGGGGGARVPGVGLGGGFSGAQNSIPAAGATVGTPTQPTQAGAPVVPQGPPAGGGTAAAGGGAGVPPMMPPMGGMGAGMGGGGTGPGSGPNRRPVNGRPRGDGRTPGLPPVLSGKAGKADANTFASRVRRSTVETDVPTTVQLIDEDLWQVGDRPAAPVGDRAGRRAGR